MNQEYIRNYQQYFVLFIYLLYSLTDSHSATWSCTRCMEKVKHILPNGGVMVIYHGRNQKIHPKQIQGDKVRTWTEWGPP